MVAGPSWAWGAEASLLTVHHAGLTRSQGSCEACSQGRERTPAGRTELTTLVGIAATGGMPEPLSGVPCASAVSLRPGQAGEKAPAARPHRGDSALALRCLGRQPGNCLHPTPCPPSCLTPGKAIKGLQASLFLWETRGQKSPGNMVRMQRRGRSLWPPLDRAGLLASEELRPGRGCVWRERRSGLLHIRGWEETLWRGMGPRAGLHPAEATAKESC